MIAALRRCGVLLVLIIRSLSEFSCCVGEACEVFVIGGQEGLWNL